MLPCGKIGMIQELENQGKRCLILIIIADFG